MRLLCVRVSGRAGPSADILIQSPRWGLKNAIWDDFLQMALDDHLAALIAAVREMGGSGGNIKLREKLGWDEAAYDAVRDQAIAAGKLVAGRGRGGSLRLPDSDGALPFPADDAAAPDQTISGCWPQAGKGGVVDTSGLALSA